MFTVEVLNYFGEPEQWAWDCLEHLQNDYNMGDMLALPNDFDKVTKAFVRGKEIFVDTFGEFIQYIKDNVGWK